LRTDLIVQALAEGAHRIGHVVGLIANTAGPTNLLALNATVRAAEQTRRSRSRALFKNVNLRFKRFPLK
jgi:hypothetical protein